MSADATTILPSPTIEAAVVEACEAGAELARELDPRGRGRRRSKQGEGYDSVSTAVAEAEIALCADAEVGLGGVDAFDRRGGRYPELSAEAQQELVCAYQAALRVIPELEKRLERGRSSASREATATQLRYERRAAERALTYLLGAVSRLLRQIAQEHAGRGGRDGQELASEYTSEAMIVASEAAQSFEAHHGPSFSQYVSMRVRQHLGTLSASTLPGTMPPAWERVHRLALGVGPELAEELGRRPSTEELQERLRERAWAWAYERLSPEQLQADEASQRAAAEQKLAKQGMLKAIDDLRLVLARAQQPLELDAPLGGEEEETSHGEMLADETDVEGEVERRETRAELSVLLEMGFGGCGAQERELLLARLGEIDGEEWSFAKINAAYASSTAETRLLLKTVRTRLRASHAQYSYLCDGVGAQFEEIALEEGVLASFRRMRRARRVTL